MASKKDMASAKALIREELKAHRFNLSVNRKLADKLFQPYFSLTSGPSCDTLYGLQNDALDKTSYERRCSVGLTLALYALEQLDHEKVLALKINL